MCSIVHTQKGDDTIASLVPLSFLLSLSLSFSLVLNTIYTVEWRCFYAHAFTMKKQQQQQYRREFTFIISNTHILT